MSRNNRNSTVAALGVALAGMVIAGSSFAMQPLAQGYAVAAAKVAPEGKCGEGKCGDAKFNAIDTDDDARVSLAEFLAVAPGQNALFATKDTNHDGYISELESYKSIKGIYESNGRKVPAGLFSKHPSK
ncbi:HvfA family oxazolone/thioamide-modified RiPP metallophore [Lysobacter solisilvae (ex Woo and Kim 2020)]|uniref:EF-hand domain-containing protein n=1 Tax=Agrilutibacter terrestris TaxID=2865112 RepID=A0A7H0FXJ9_9GAMM|nr:EF-hand domain-containing protein [Lysobacter terrestris]QNP40765.1 EF-hand domain-containing protein [Lysobacter terrestris]